MLARLLMKPEHAVSHATLLCLSKLQSHTLKFCSTKPKEEDINHELGPLLNLTLVFIASLNSLQESLSHEPGTNLEALRLKLGKDTSIIRARIVFQPFFEAMGLEFEIEAETYDDDDAAGGSLDREAHEGKVKDEIDVVWSAVTEALIRWRNTFPEPPANSVS
jgi:hypothetical protein